MTNKTIVGTLISGCFLACSPTARIAQSTVDIRGNAQRSKERFDKIHAESVKTTPNMKTITNQSKVGAREQEIIIGETNDISVQLTKVEDSVPWWATLLQWVMICFSVLGVLGLLWYTGIGTIIKKLLNNLGLLIPERKKTAAKLLEESLSDPVKVREAIAAMRASDPTFDAAYRKVHKKG